MADELDALLQRIEDEGLRAELSLHIERLRRRRQFGLVFESHLPERVRLPDYPIRRGSRVVCKNAPPKETPREVLSVTGDVVDLDADGETEKVPLEELVVVAEFGEPIYPGFRNIGSIDRGGNKPAHVVIKGENYHALEALRFSHTGRVDCIYIDPPYNSGARDWKYDNAYVDADDAYRHSKWLAFMERRLRLAGDLMNPESSVLIVTIDEKEYLRMGLLLRQVFPNSTIQMVSSLINPKGTGRTNEFRRVDEYLFFVWFGDARIGRVTRGQSDDTGGGQVGVDWQTFRRRDLASIRPTRPSQFYPIYVNTNTGLIEDVGQPLDHQTPRGEAPQRDGCVAVFPVRPDGTEMNWSVTAPTCISRWRKGFLRAGKPRPNEPQQYIIQYLKAGTIRDIEEGRAEVKGRNSDGSVIAAYSTAKGTLPTTQWNIASHSAEHYGTGLVKTLLQSRQFPFPKSLYAVEDALRLFVGENPNAVVLDFFVGSGTTTHAVARLNRQDGGQRQSIVVTNNEVSQQEAESLRAKGLRPGDAAWEQFGIFEHIARPRISAAITGLTPHGEAVRGDYKFTDEFPMSDGFEENVEFFELKYLDVEDVELDLAFESVAPLLWLRAGGIGPTIRQRCEDSGKPKHFDMTSRYGVLFDPDYWRGFVEELRESVTTVFVVTDSPSVFASVAAELRSYIDVVRLYENYLSTFTVNRGL